MQIAKRKRKRKYKSCIHNTSAYRYFPVPELRLMTRKLTICVSIAFVEPLRGVKKTHRREKIIMIIKSQPTHTNDARINEIVCKCLVAFPSNVYGRLSRTLAAIDDGLVQCGQVECKGWYEKKRKKDEEAGMREMVEGLYLCKLTCRAYILLLLYEVI